MIKKEFINSIANGKVNVIQLILDILNKTNTRYCLIGGLAVNAYVEPVVSLDIDIVAAVENIDRIINHAEERGFKVDYYEHSVNLTSQASDLRIRFQTDPRYQSFISKATIRNVLGYEMKVAAVEDILQGKIWAWMDLKRRRSKRQKDFADMLRILESYRELEEMLPQELKDQLREEDP